MLPQFDGFGELVKFAGALATVTVGMAWWRKGSPEQDEVMVESTDVLIDGISDADKTSKIDLHTGRNIRDQLTVEEAEKMQQDRKWYSNDRRN